MAPALVMTAVPAGMAAACTLVIAHPVAVGVHKPAVAPPVVTDAVAVGIPYYVTLMYVQFYDVTGAERMDLNKTDLWSKRVVRKDKKTLRDKK